MKHCLTKRVLIATLIIGSIGFSNCIAKADTSNITAMQQKKGRTVTRTVTDAADETPIIGANILLKGSQTGVISSLNGFYFIQVNKIRDCELQFLYCSRRNATTYCKLQCSG